MGGIEHAMQAVDFEPSTGNNARRDKQFATTRGELARHGYGLARTDPADGPVSFFVSRHGLVREIDNIEVVQRVLIDLAGSRVQRVG